MSNNVGMWPNNRGAKAPFFVCFGDLICTLSTMTQEKIDIATAQLKEMLKPGGKVYGINYGTSFKPRLALYCVFANDIRRITFDASIVCELKYRNTIEQVVYGFNPGGSPLQYVTDLLTERLGYQAEPLKSEYL